MNKSTYLLALALSCLFSCNTGEQTVEEQQPIEAPISTETTLDSSLQAEEQPIDPTSTAPQTTSSLNFLKAFEGKYAHDVKLLEHPLLKERLFELLENRMKDLEYVMEVSTPLEIKGNYVIYQAMLAHSGGDSEGIILFDLVKDNIQVGLRVDKKESFFMETNDNNPYPCKLLQDWAESL